MLDIQNKFCAEIVFAHNAISKMHSTIINTSMQELLNSAKRILREKQHLPFSIYSSVKEQNIFNVPILKPLLVCVLDGQKQLGSNEVNCFAGEFIFLANNPNIDMRNIPNDVEYSALLVEFEYEDFACFSHNANSKEKYIQGKIEPIFEKTLQQFVEWSAFAPADIWGHRRQEILQLVYHMGYQKVSSLNEPPSLSHKINNIISEHIADDLSMAELSAKVAMSESTLRRKLNIEGTSLQTIKDRVKLGYGLHLVQTSTAPIGLIAEKCGYHSQSRFTDKFKQLFGITPSELRKTRMIDSGE